MKKKKSAASAATTESAETTRARVDHGERAVLWVAAKKNYLLIGAAGIVLVGIIAYSTWAQSARREAFAESALNQARMSMSVGDLFLGTRAGDAFDKGDQHRSASSQRQPLSR